MKPPLPPLYIIFITTTTLLNCVQNPSVTLPLQQESYPPEGRTLCKKITCYQELGVSRQGMSYTAALWTSENESTVGA